MTAFALVDESGLAHPSPRRLGLPPSQSEPTERASLALPAKDTDPDSTKPKKKGGVTILPNGRDCVQIASQGGRARQMRGSS